MAQATHLYFDHPYEPDPEERGFYWATRYTDTRKTFGFMPDDIYGNIKEKRSGEALSRETFCAEAQACTSLGKRENVVGMPNCKKFKEPCSPGRGLLLFLSTPHNKTGDMSHEHCQIVPVTL